MKKYFIILFFFFQILQAQNNWYSAVSSGIPNPQKVNQLWNGKIVGNYCICENGDSLLITGKDFDSNWTQGIPYKSACLISQTGKWKKATVKDTGNFWFASDSTPNLIPVISFFQNINYADRIFCKHEAQRLDANGIETYEPRISQICTYISEQKNTDSIFANRYFQTPRRAVAHFRLVPQQYATIRLAIAGATSNDTIYINSGDYSDNAYQAITNKNLHFIGLGRVKYTHTGGTYAQYMNNSNCTYEGIDFVPSQAYLFGGASASTAATLGLKRCRFNSGNSMIDDNTTKWLVNLTIDNCIIGNNTTTSLITNWFQAVSITNSIISNTRNFMYNGFTFSHNKVIHNYTTSLVATIQVSDGNCNLFDNNISNNYRIVTAASTDTFDFDVKYNNIKTISRAAATDYQLFTVSGTAYYEWEVKNNRICSYITDKSGYFFSLKNQNVDVQENIMISMSCLTKYINHFVAPTDGNRVGLTGIYKNNYNLSDATAEQIVYFGTDFTDQTNQYNGSEISGNYVKGGFANHPLETGLLHGICIFGGINYTIKHNWVEDCEVGIVVKNAQQKFTAGGVYANITKNCYRDIYIGGVDSIMVVNNTTYNNNGYTYNFYAGFSIATYTVGANNYNCRSAVLKNNIAHSLESTGTCVEQFTGSSGSIFQNNQVYGGQYLYQVYNGTGYSGLTTAQSAGYLLNCNSANPNFKSETQLWPITAITTNAVNLGSPYNILLDTTTNWGDTLHVPTIVTKTGSGQMGAYLK